MQVRLQVLFQAAAGDRFLTHCYWILAGNVLRLCALCSAKILFEITCTTPCATLSVK